MIKATVTLVFFLFLLGPVQCQPKGLTMDGVAMDMSYSQVLEVLGLPKSLNEERGLMVFSYPAPNKRSEATSVWFEQGKVVYASGYTLERDGEPLFLYGMVGEILEDQFGPSEPLGDFARWWPTNGLVLTGSNAIWPSKELTAPVGLRSLEVPRDHAKPQGGSNVDPWVDDETTAWMVDDISLGMPEEQARKLAGDLDVSYRGGFVQAIRAPKSAIFSRHMGGRDVSLLFDLGEPPQVFGQGPPISPPSNGWFEPSASGKVRLRRGKVVEIQLRMPQDGAFEALSEYRAKAERMRLCGVSSSAVANAPENLKVLEKGE